MNRLYCKKFSVNRLKHTNIRISDIEKDYRYINSLINDNKIVHYYDKKKNKLFC